MQDIITYAIIFYAVVYTTWNTVKAFIPARGKANQDTCSSCSGCSARKECSAAGFTKSPSVLSEE